MLRGVDQIIGARNRIAIDGHCTQDGIDLRRIERCHELVTFTPGAWDLVAKTDVDGQLWRDGPVVLHEVSLIVDGAEGRRRNLDDAGRGSLIDHIAHEEGCKRMTSSVVVTEGVDESIELQGTAGGVVLEVVHLHASKIGTSFDRVLPERLANVLSLIHISEPTRQAEISY